MTISLKALFFFTDLQYGLTTHLVFLFGAFLFVFYILGIFLFNEYGLTSMIISVLFIQI